jgi:hypothetical protein
MGAWEPPPSDRSGDDPSATPPAGQSQPDGVPAFGAPPGGAYGPSPGAPPRGNGAAVASLVCGIIALVLSWIPFINVLALILGVVAVVTGIIGLRRTREPAVGGKGLAVAGLTTGIVGALLAVWVLASVMIAFQDPGVQELFRELQEQQQGGD